MRETFSVKELDIKQVKILVAIYKRLRADQT